MRIRDLLRPMLDIARWERDKPLTINFVDPRDVQWMLFIA